MKVPVSPTVGLNPDRRPDVTADRLVPVDNPQARIGRQVSQSVEEAGNTVLRVDALLQERVDRGRAREADAKIANGFREIMSSPKGYRNKVGRAAIDDRESTITALDEHRRLILTTLTPHQRELMADSDETRYQHTRAQIDSHYAQQTEAYEMGEMDARANELMLDAVESAFAPEVPGGVIDPEAEGDPSLSRASAFEDYRAGMRTEIASLAARRGMGEAATRELLAKADDNLHAGVISRLISEGKATEAQSYLDEKVKAGQITAGAKTRLTDGLDMAVTKEQGNRVAQRLSLSPDNLSAKFAQLQQLYDNNQLGKNKDAVFKEALQQLTQHDKLVDEELKRQQTEAWTRVERYAQLHGGVLDAEHQKLLTDTKQDDRYTLFLQRGQQWVTTEVGHYALTVMSGRELREKFPTEAVLRFNYRFELTTPDLDNLTKRWREGVGDMPKLDKSIVLADGLRDALGVAKEKPVDKDLFDRWANSVNVEIRRLMAAKPGSTEEEHWDAAITAAKENGFFLDAAGERRRLFIQAAETEYDDTDDAIFFRLPDGRMVGGTAGIPLGKINPASGLTYVDSVRAMLDNEALDERPGKPKGFVMLPDQSGQMRPVAVQNVTLRDVLGLAATAIEAQTATENTQRKSVGQEWVRNAFNEEFRRFAFPDYGVGRAPDETRTLPPRQLAEARSKAASAVWRRRAEFQGFQLTDEEVYAAMGLTAEEREKQARALEEAGFPRYYSPQGSKAR